MKEYGLKSLRNQVAVVLQKNILFSGTIQSNIAYSDEGMPEERVELAAQVAQVMGAPCYRVGELRARPLAQLVRGHSPAAG